ncbi:MAG TPA: DMT family transporter [Chthonomonadaceae bacterium]|nr:DMT family transporter [Chthonomonadaceae bacterium]
MSLPTLDPPLPVPDSPAQPRPAGASLTLAAAGLLVAINLLWSGSSVASKDGLADFGPITLALCRFLPAGCILYALEARKGHPPRFARRDWPALFLLGSLGIALTYFIFYAGVQRTTASDSSLMFACEPLLIALFAVLFLRERLHPMQWLGMFAGIYGIWLIAGQASGNALAVLALAVESSVSVIGKRLAERYRGLTLCAGELLVGAACLAPFAVWECIAHPPHITAAGVASALYLCLVCTAICYGVWYRLLERFPISAMGAFILIQPMLGPVWGFALRHEPLRRASAAGGALVIFGLILTSLVRFGSRQRSEPAVLGSER